MNWHKFYSIEFVFYCDGISKCNCGGIIKLDVVLYEEGLDVEILLKSINSIQNADFLIVVDTFLTVQPAVSLINYFNGDNLVFIIRMQIHMIKKLT